MRLAVVVKGFVTVALFIVKVGKVKIVFVIAIRVDACRVEDNGRGCATIFELKILAIYFSSLIMVELREVVIGCSIGCCRLRITPYSCGNGSKN